jgi:hypothetical protein
LLRYQKFKKNRLLLRKYRNWEGEFKRHPFYGRASLSIINKKVEGLNIIHLGRVGGQWNKMMFNKKAEIMLERVGRAME